MNKTLAELNLERGRLLERIAYQRQTLAQQWIPVHDAEQAGRRLLERWAAGVQFVKSRPWLFAVLLATVWVVKPRRVWPLVVRGAALWRGWRLVRRVIPAKVLSVLTEVLSAQLPNKRRR